MKYLTIIDHGHSTIALWSNEVMEYENILISQTGEIGINVPEDYIDNILRDYCAPPQMLRLVDKDGKWYDLDNPGTNEIITYIHKSSYGGDGGAITFYTGLDSLPRWMLAGAQQ